MKTILIYYIEIVKQRCDNVLFIIQVRQCSLQDKIRLTHLQVMYLAQLRTGRALPLSVLRQEHVSPALPGTQRCLCAHHTRRILVTTALAFFPFTLFKCQRFLFPLLPEKRRCTMCKEVLMLAPPWSGDTERQTQLTPAVPARLNSQQSSVFPVFLDTHIPASSHPS